MAELLRVLETHRLVTLLGPGGVGKTRTALQVGADLLARAEIGVWLVELGAVEQPSFVAAEVVKALRVRIQTTREPGNELIAYLKRRELLLILDNCEHVVATAAQLVAALLRACPGLRVLATSREPLKVDGEQTYRLSSLHEDAAVTLFAERAREVDLRFALSDENRATVAEICRRLDGIPLAIEFAAARVNLLPVGALLERLDQRLRLLSGRDRTTLRRHQTLRALIDWSYNLLSNPEQRVFARLAVFVAGGPLSIIVDVCIGDDIVNEDAVLELLASLADKSLVVADVAGLEPRYRLLETSREYAREQLAAHGDQQIAAHRHALAYAKLAEQLDRTWDAGADRTWIARAEAELANWRAALAWSLEAGGDIVCGQRLAGALRLVWMNFAYAEGRRWVRLGLNLVDHTTPIDVVAQLDFADAQIAASLSELEVALAASRRALARYHQLGDALGATRAQDLAGRILAYLGRGTQAVPLLEEALQTARGLGNQRLIALVLESFAHARSAIGDVGGARSLFAEALALHNALGSERAAAIVASYLAEAEFRAGNAEAAFSAVSDALALGRTLGHTYQVANNLANMSAYLIALDRYDAALATAREGLALALELEHYHLTWAIQHLAAIAALSPQPNVSRAARLIAFVDARLARHNGVRQYTEQLEYERLISRLRETLTADALHDAMLSGSTLNEAQAIADAQLVGVRTEKTIRGSPKTGCPSPICRRLSS